MDHHICPWWLAYSFDNPFRRLVHNGPKMLSPYVKGEMTVADLGCGLGYFTIEMAKLLTGNGHVIAVDLQEEMLSAVMRRAKRKGLANRIIPHLCHSDDLKLEESLDFALAFWMVHEVPGAEAFFRQVSNVLKPGGKLLITEPLMHVNKKQFLRSLDIARDSGFTVSGYPQVFFSRSALLETGK